VILYNNKYIDPNHEKDMMRAHKRYPAFDEGFLFNPYAKPKAKKKKKKKKG